MDRHEAILRELNLYPLWVRRDAVPEAEAPEPAPAEPLAAPEPPAAEVPAADIFVAAAEPAAADAAATLREFQLQNQGGALAAQRQRKAIERLDLVGAFSFGGKIRHHVA